MSLPANNTVESVVDAIKTSQPTATDPTTAGKIAEGTQNFDSATRISSVEQLQKQAPELWKAMLQGIALSICNQMEDHTRRLRELMRKSRQDAGG